MGSTAGFTMSFDEIIITYFLTSTYNTLPIYLYGMLRFGLSPEVYAISTVVLGLSILLIILMAKYTGAERNQLLSVNGIIYLACLPPPLLLWFFALNGHWEQSSS